MSFSNRSHKRAKFQVDARDSQYSYREVCHNLIGYWVAQ